MNIIAVDDEPSSLETLARAVYMAEPTAQVFCFDEAEQALECARQQQIDAAFLDIEMGGMSGLALAQQLQALRRSTNVIFVTAYSNYTAAALNLRVSGYVMKPIDPRRVREELDNLRHPPQAAAKPPLVTGLGRYRFDHEFKRVFCAGRDVMLHPREYNIFYQLAAHPGVYFTAQELYEKTSGQEAADDVSTIYSHMSRLRKKLGLDDAGTEKDIEIEHTRGKGYRLVIHSE